MVFTLLLCYNACNKPEEKVFTMSIENGEWIMRGLEWGDPCRVRTWQNKKFQERLKTFTGWTAQIIQHEIDHCEGIII